MMMSLLLAMAAQAPGSVATATSPDIVVKGKPVLVCTTIRMTGSRAARSRRCVTKEEAALEAEMTRRATEDARSITRVRDATACGPPNVQMCD